MIKILENITSPYDSLKLVY